MAKRIAGDWRTRLLLLFSTILIGTLFVQIFSIVPYIQDQQLDNALDRHEEIAISLAREGDKEIEHIVNELATLANHSVFRNMEIENQTDFMFQYLEVVPGVGSLTVLNSTGWFVSGTVDDFELYYTTMSFDFLPFFYVPFEQGKPDYGNPFWYDTYPDLVAISISVPIRSDNGEIVGVLMGVIDLCDLIESITNYPLDEDVIAYLVDQRGIVLAHSEIDLFSLEEGPLSLNYSGLDLVGEFKSDNSSIAHMHDHESEIYCGVALALDTTKWMMAVEAPLSSIMADGNTMVANLWSFNIVLFGITLTIAIAFAQQIVSQQEQKN
jgi:hypothetical protein